MRHHDEKSINWKGHAIKTAAAFAVAALGYGSVYGLSEYVRDNEAAIKIKAGKLVDTDVPTGVKFDSLLPKVEYIKYPTTLQTITVSATEDDNFAVRTAEKARIYGDFKVKYTIDKADANFGQMWSLQKAETLAGIEDDIADYTIPAGIDIYKTVAAADVNDDLTKIGGRVAERLQDILNDRGFTYIHVHDIVPTGMGLSDEANADLEKIVSEERRVALLDAQALTAGKAAEVVGVQTSVTVGAIDALRASGVPEEQLAQFYCLQLHRDADKIGTQFTASCIAAANDTPVGFSVSSAPNSPAVSATMPALTK